MSRPRLRQNKAPGNRFSGALFCRGRSLWRNINLPLHCRGCILCLFFYKWTVYALPTCKFSWQLSVFGNNAIFIEHQLNFTYRKWRIAPVDYRMAIGAKRYKITHRVDHVSCAEIRDRGDVMYFDEACCNFPITFFHVDAAYTAASSVNRDCGCAVPPVPFITVRLNGGECTLWIPSDAAIDNPIILFQG